jgi:hypothetical protein
MFGLLPAAPYSQWHGSSVRGSRDLPFSSLLGECLTATASDRLATAVALAKAWGSDGSQWVRDTAKTASGNLKAELRDDDWGATSQVRPCGTPHFPTQDSTIPGLPVRDDLGCV